MSRHDAAVAEIAQQIRKFYELKTPFRIYHGSTNSTRPSQFRHDETVDTSSLSNILKIDTETNTALVEPNVPMDRLVEATLQHGLVPPVVMEFPGITTGGGYAGTSGESSSFKHGFFEHTINSAEMVLPTGQVVTASPTDKPDLFYGAASSFGTLGVTTLLEVRLIKASPFVELTYHPVSSVPEAVEKIQDATKNTSNDYVDGILFSRESGVICTGRLQDKVQPGTNIQRFSRAKDPWFYLHAKTINDTGTPTTETIPIVDYLFRYDRGGFWVGHFAFKYFMVPFNRATRWALDDCLHTRAMYHALHQSGLSKRYIIQDVGIPYPKVSEFIDYLDGALGIYPLWLCPLRQAAHAQRPLFSPFAQKCGLRGLETLLNVGIWGIGPEKREDFIKANRELEDKVHELNGKKWLYAHTYYTEEEFWNIYDCEEYAALRTKYNATYLPNVYDKVKIDLTTETRSINESWIAYLRSSIWNIWPLGALYGLFHAAYGRDYLLPRKPLWGSRSSKKD
jgi:Delta24-sterol reductase